MIAFRIFPVDEELEDEGSMVAGGSACAQIWRGIMGDVLLYTWLANTAYRVVDAQYGPANMWQSTLFKAECRNLAGDVAARSRLSLGTQGRHGVRYLCRRKIAAPASDHRRRSCGTLLP